MNANPKPFFTPGNPWRFTSETGTAAGSVSSPAKQRAARRNGKLHLGRRRSGSRPGPVKSIQWTTPPDLYARLDLEFHFTLDAAATRENALCSRFYTPTDDGLSRPWAPERVWVNPPYSRDLPRWIAKAYTESQRGALVVALLPARTDTRWWHDFIDGKSEVRFLRGRVTFGDAPMPAPFASAIVIFRPPTVGIL